MVTSDQADKAIDTILRREMSGIAPASAACPEAATLAAWFDRSLVPGDSFRVETHLEDCTRCQSIVGAMARTEGESAPRRVRVRLPWFLDIRLAVPMAAGIVAIFALGGVFHDKYYDRGEAEVTAMAERREIRPAYPRAAAPLSSEPSQVEQYSNQSANLANPIPPAARGTRAPALMKSQPPRSSDASAGAAADVSSMTERQARPALVRGQKVLVASPNHLVSWLVGPGGDIVRIDSTGNSLSRAPGVAADLTAGSALSSQLCWVVGMRGTIVRTTNGRDWERVKSPTTRDLYNIEAHSADSATIYALDGTVFSTGDAGRTWTKKTTD